MTTSWQTHRLLFGCLSFPDTIGETNWAKCNYSPFDSDWLKIPHLSQLAHGILPASMIIQGLAYDQIQANEAQEDTFGVLLKENHQKRWFLSSSGVLGYGSEPQGCCSTFYQPENQATLWRRRAERFSREDGLHRTKADHCPANGLVIYLEQLISHIFEDTLR